MSPITTEQEKQIIITCHFQLLFFSKATISVGTFVINLFKLIDDFIFIY